MEYKYYLSFNLRVLFFPMDTKLLGYTHTHPQTRKLVGSNYLINKTTRNFFWPWGKITG